MDLDLVLKWATRRNAILLALAILAFPLAERGFAVAQARYRVWRYPPQKAAPDARSQALVLELDRAASRRLRTLHRAVTAEIASAEAKGLKTGGLRRLADATLSLDHPKYRALAFQKLNEVRLKIPTGDSVRPVSPEDDRFDIPPDVKGRARRRRR